VVGVVSPSTAPQAPGAADKKLSILDEVRRMVRRDAERERRKAHREQMQVRACALPCCVVDRWPSAGRNAAFL